nr:chemotaxis protein CheB [Methylovulum psychrotolerans]
MNGPCSISSGKAAAFPIVGIGASAGGLEALGQFLHTIPANSGFAFVLVSHLDPSHTSLLTEILQRTTHLAVQGRHAAAVNEQHQWRSHSSHWPE